MATLPTWTPPNYYGAYVVNGETFSSDLLARELATPEGLDVLYRISGYKNTFTNLVNILNKNMVRKQVQGVDGIIHSMIQAPTNVSAKIATRSAASSSSITATVALGTYKNAVNIIKNTLIQDVAYRTFARVSDASISGSTLTLTLVPVADGGSFSGSPVTAFAAGAAIVSYGQNIQDVASANRTSLSAAEPEFQSDNYLQILGSATSFGRRDMAKTFVDQVWKAGMARPAVILNAEAEAMRVFSSQIELNWLEGQAAISTTVSGNGGAGRAHTNGGLAWAIANRGGVVDTSTDNTEYYFGSSTASQLADGLAYLLDVLTLLRRTSGKSGEYLVLAGATARMGLVALMQPYKTTAGTNSVLAGKGINVDSFSTPVGTLSFVDLNAYNDPYMFQQQTWASTGLDMKSSEFYIIPLEPTMTQDDGLVAPIRKCYFNFEGVAMTTKNGICDMNGNPISTSYNDTDGITSLLTYDGGIDIPNAVGFYHYKPVNA